jgi:hypothetical protein
MGSHRRGQGRRIVIEASPNSHTKIAKSRDDDDMNHRRITAPLRVVRQSRIVRRAIRRIAGTPESQLRARS